MRQRLPFLAGLGFGLAMVGLVAAGRLQAQSRIKSPHGTLDIDCAECHTPERWTPVLRTPTFRHERTGFVLQASHSQVPCASCHRRLVFSQVGTACVDCHQDAHRGELGTLCENCHSPSTWSNQREMFQVHNRTRFPLFAVHAKVDCQACHRGQRPFEYATTSTECGSCHARTFEATTSPNHVVAGFSRRCEDCHRLTAMDWRTSAFNHTTFPLRGVHARAACARCHTMGYRGTPRDCQGCHRSDYDRAANPNHVTSRFPLECDSCHQETGWRPASGVDHALTRFPLTGAHQRVQCERCHAGGRYAGTPMECMACHQPDYNRATNPNHVAGRFSSNCETCHTTAAWRPAGIDHNKTGFPLSGAHQRVECALCHVGGRYAGTPKDCYSCHQKDYTRVTNPNHVAGHFSTGCDFCHNTNAWRPASVDHNKTAFPLTGAHRSVSCEACHPGGRYTGTSRDCYACHQKDYAGAANPSHATFPKECVTCHTTNAWKPANFDHNKTAFPLTGAHRGTPCASCHPGGKYAGTSKDCFSCHASDYNGTSNPNHTAAGFPKSCQDCHQTTAWKPATFNHDGAFFPIYSGKHKGKWSACTDCHKNPGNYKSFECILCHEHNNKAELDNKHKGVSGYSYSSLACYKCHPQGKH